MLHLQQSRTLLMIVMTMFIKKIYLEPRVHIGKDIRYVDSYLKDLVPQV